MADTTLSDEPAVLATYRAQLAAMTAGRTDRLSDLLDDGFTLTHITGYVQPRAEWLAQMDAGQFVYHDVREAESTVALTRDTAHITSRIATDATVYGTRHDWRLCFDTDLRQQDGRWVILRTVATTW